jgi:hypothetical protein
MAKDFLRSVISREPESLNTLAANKFRLIFHRIPGVTFFCQTINLPGVNLNEFQQPTPFAAPVRRPGGGLTLDNLDLTFLISEDLANYRSLLDWLYAIPPTVDYSGYNKKHSELYSDATLVVLNSSSRPSFSMKFNDCFPLSIGSVEFQTNVSDVVPLTCQATFAFSRFYFENIDKL